MEPAPAMEQSVPEGWIVTSQTRRSGQVDKCYYNPSTGYKFRSRKALFQHLASENPASPLPSKERSIVIYTGSDTNTSSNQRSSVDIKSQKNTQSSSDELPDGWIKIHKPRKASTDRRVKRDPYYIDPVSGYAFRSRMDAFRYLATGDISKCIIKPKKADECNLYATENEDRVPSEKKNKGLVGFPIEFGVSHMLIAKQPVAQVNRTPSCEAIKRKQMAKQPDAQANRTPSSSDIEREQSDAEASRTPSSEAVNPEANRTPSSGAVNPEANRTPSSGAVNPGVNRTPSSGTVNPEANRTPSSGAWRRPTVHIGDSPKWLPSGWITEIKTQQSGQNAGYTYQCYFNPFTETRFYTKKKVLRYLESEGFRRPSMNKETSTETKSAGDILTSSNQSGTIKNKEINIETNSTGDILTSGNQSGTIKNKEINIKTNSTGDIHTSGTQTGSTDNKGTNNTGYSSDAELPDGWVKEIRFRYSRSRLHKDPYYLDPVSEYAFRSKKDALRYLRTGDLKKCAMRPKTKDMINMYPLKKGQSSNKPLPVGEGGQQHQDPVDSQKKRSAAQLRPRRTKSFKAIALRSSKRLAGTKSNHVTGSRKSGSEAMPIVELDFFEVEETTLSGNGTVKNQEGSAIGLPDQSPVRADNVVETVTSKPVASVVGKSDVSKTMDTKLEQVAVMPVQGAVRDGGKSNEREVSHTSVEKLKGAMTEQVPLTLPTVNEGTMAKKPTKVPVSKKPRKLTVSKKSDQGAGQSGTKSEGTMASKPEKLPVTPAQGGTKSEAAPTVNKGMMASKSEKHPVMPVQGGTAPTVNKGTMASKSEKLPVTPVQGGTAPTVNKGMMASKPEKLPVTPVQGADQSGAKSELLEAAPTVNLDFFEKLVAEEHPELGERKPIGDTPDSPLILPFGDSWSDPCLEFAFKTLTGDIPVLEDTAAIEDYFQQQTVQSSSPVPEPRASGGALENSSLSGRKRKAGDGGGN